MRAIKNTLYYIMIVLLPKNIASQFMGILASWKPPYRWAIFINKTFASIFNINIAEAEKPLNEYKSLQEFFIRRLKPDLRPLDKEANSIISPCDGKLSESGIIVNGKLVQVKGRLYSLQKLLGDGKLAERFEGGTYATIYLSPRDYHRFHMPLNGKITDTIYFPGSLWPVNPWAVANIKDLFCINERIISLITPNDSTKSIAHIAVGATMVGKIKLAYNQIESNGKFEQRHLKHEGAAEVCLKKGDELGLFMFGSSIILLFEKGLIESLIPEKKVHLQMGQKIAVYRSNAK